MFTDISAKTYQIYILVFIFVLIHNEIEAFFPQQTQRWWHKKQISLGPPISHEEKIASLLLPIEPPSRYSQKYLESQRLHEGDIYWTQNLELPKENQNRRFVQGLHTWPDGEVPYLIENSFDEKERLHVARAITEIESKSCVRFVPRDGGYNYIYLHKGKDCASNVGRIGGGQPISLAPRCINFGIIIHELLHTLGFWHEQSRYDRRDYINIHWFNIKPLMLPNFFVSPYYVLSDVGLPYDYESVMHYGDNSFARNPDKPTISPKQEGVKIGQRTGLSKLNTEGLNLLYECDTHIPHNSLDQLAQSSNHHHQREISHNTGCQDLWFFCLAPRVVGGCWWGDYMMRRYCRKSCGLCS